MADSRSPMSFTDVAKGDSVKSLQAETLEDASKYVLGAIMLIVLLIVIGTLINPDGNLKTLAVATASLADCESDSLRALRLSAELQTVLLIAGIVICAMYYLSSAKTASKSATVSKVVLAIVAVVALGLVLTRQASYLHLDIFYGVLAFLYLIVAVVGVAASISFMRMKNYAGGVLFAVFSALFLTAFAGAVSVSIKALTGDAAKAALVAHGIQP